MSEHIGVELVVLGEVLSSEQPAAVQRWAYNRLLELTEALGAHLDADATTGQPAPWDDPIWPEGSEVVNCFVPGCKMPGHR